MINFLVLNRVRNLNTLKKGETLTFEWFGHETSTGTYDGRAPSQQSDERIESGDYLVLKNVTELYESVHFWTTESKLQKNLKDFGGEPAPFGYFPIKDTKVYRTPNIDLS